MKYFFRYRSAGSEVINVLCRFSECVERASIDEAYLDFTKVISDKYPNLDDFMTFKESIQASRFPSTWVEGFSSNSEDKESKNVV